MRRSLPLLIAVVFCTQCRSDSDRSNADKVNKDKFRQNRQTEAHFVVDVLDTSYGLIELAKIGEARIANRHAKAEVQKIIHGQTSALIRLKTFAERRGIVIPMSGPEKTKRSVRRLEKKEGSGFTKAWVDEMKRLQHNLKSDIESFQRKSGDTALIHVLDSTLLMVRANNAIISRLDTETNDESI